MRKRTHCTQFRSRVAQRRCSLSGSYQLLWHSWGSYCSETRRRSRRKAVWAVDKKRRPNCSDFVAKTRRKPRQDRMNVPYLHSELLEKDWRTGWKATSVDVVPQLGTFTTPYCCSALLGFKLNCTVQPSIEVAEMIELFALDVGVNESWFGRAQFTLVWMPVVLIPMVPFR